MNKIQEFLAGKKTYIIAAVAAVSVFGQAMGWWTELPEWFYGLLASLGVVALRAGVKKGEV